MSPGVRVNNRQMGGAGGWVDSMSQAREQRTQSQEVRDQKYGRKERSVRCQRDGQKGWAQTGTKL